MPQATRYPWPAPGGIIAAQLPGAGWAQDGYPEAAMVTGVRVAARVVRRASATGPLEGLSVRIEDGFSVITGGIIDQPQLHGVLDWLGGRGIEIVSLSPAESIDEAGDMGG
jgi:hypothetical protein